MRETSPDILTTPAFGATQTRTMSSIGEDATNSACSFGSISITDVSIFPPYIMGLGVSALLKVNVGTAFPCASYSIWLKYTLPFDTRSTSPSPFISEKYSVTLVFVLEASTPNWAVSACHPTTALPPPELVELFVVEKFDIPTTRMGSPYTISPFSSVLIWGR